MLARGGRTVTAVVDRYCVPAAPVQAELRERASRFLAHLVPAGDPAAAEAAVASLRRKHHDASHVCWAFRGVDPDGHWVERCDDAGEPARTAGPPILGAMQGAGVAALVAVVRWFGGTKLGTGGLVRAYRDAARLVLLPPHLVDTRRMKGFRATCPWREFAALRHALESREGRVVPGPGTDEAVFTVEVPAVDWEGVRRWLDEQAHRGLRWSST